MSLFEEEFYWDLKELNPDAIIFEEYHSAFMGFTFINDRYVAVYDSRELEMVIIKNLIEDPVFIDNCLKKMDGKIENSRVQEGVGRLAKIEAINLSTDLINKWANKENYPVILHYPKIVEAILEQEDNETFKYEE